MLYFECTIWFNKANKLNDFCIYMIKYLDAFNEAKCKCEWLNRSRNNTNVKENANIIAACRDEQKLVWEEPG